MSSGYSRQDEIKVFQFGDSVTYVGILGIRLMFNFKNIIASTSLGAMTSLVHQDYIQIPAIY
jgi:hypothetical protein